MAGLYVVRDIYVELMDEWLWEWSGSMIMWECIYCVYTKESLVYTQRSLVHAQDFFCVYTINVLM